MPDHVEPRGPVQTTKTVLRIIHYLEAEDGATVAELAAELGLAKSTVHRHLKTLEESLYIVNRGGTYYLGYRFLELGQYVQTRTDLYELANERVQELADNTGEAAWCVVEEHNYAVYLCRGDGPKAVQTHAKIGKREYLHTIAAGKAILANLPDRRVAAIIDTVGLPARTEDTVTDRAELESELESIRERGIAFNDGEVIPNVRAVAVPVVPNGRVIGAISITGPKNRFRGDLYREEIPKELLGVANEIELRLTYPNG